MNQHSYACPCCLTTLAPSATGYSVYIEEGEFDGNAFEVEGELDIHVCSTCNAHFAIKQGGDVLAPAEFVLSHRVKEYVYLGKVTEQLLPKIAYVFLGLLLKEGFVSNDKIESCLADMTEAQQGLFHGLMYDIAGVNSKPLFDVRLIDGKPFSESLIEAIEDLAERCRDRERLEDNAEVFLRWGNAKLEDRKPVDDMFVLLGGERLTDMLITIQADIIRKVDRKLAVG